MLVHTFYIFVVYLLALHYQDDLHKWERHDDNWKSKTHLNPSENNLELGKQQLISLVHGESVKRNHYNHST